MTWLLWSYTSAQVLLVVKNPPASAEDIKDMSSIPGSGRFPWRGKWQPTPVLLPGESHGQRSLVHGVAKGQTRLKQHYIYSLIGR